MKDNFISLQTNLIDYFVPSVLGLCETRLTNKLQDFYQLPGFNLFSNNNTSNKGGVCLYVNSRLTVVLKPELSFIRPGIETIFVDIHSDSENKTIEMVYRMVSEISVDDFSAEINAIFDSIDVAT